MDNPTISGFTPGRTGKYPGKTGVTRQGALSPSMAGPLSREMMRKPGNETGSASRYRPAGILLLRVPGSSFAGYPAGYTCVRAPCGICRFSAAGPAGAADKFPSPGFLPQQKDAQRDRDCFCWDGTSLAAAGDTVENHSLCAVRSRSRVPASSRGGFGDPAGAAEIKKVFSTILVTGLTLFKRPKHRCTELPGAGRSAEIPRSDTRYKHLFYR